MSSRVTGVSHVIGLKKRADFLDTCKDGFKVRKPTLILIGKHQDKEGIIPESSCRVGYTASKKVGNSVERNRCRRRLRAAVRENILRFGMADYDYVIIGRTSTITAQYSQISNDLHDALQIIAKERNKKLSSTYSITRNDAK